MVKIENIWCELFDTDVMYKHLIWFQAIQYFFYGSIGDFQKNSTFRQQVLTPHLTQQKSVVSSKLINPLVYSIRKNQHMLPKCWLLLKVIYRAIKEVLNRLESYQMFVHDVCIEKFTPIFSIFTKYLRKYAENDKICQKSGKMTFFSIFHSWFFSKSWKI